MMMVFNPCNSQQIFIRDCFIRTDDDCIAMKGIRLGSDNDNVEYITVENCLLWADRARVFSAGTRKQGAIYEAYCAS